MSDLDDGIWLAERMAQIPGIAALLADYRDACSVRARTEGRITWTHTLPPAVTVTIVGPVRDDALDDDATDDVPDAFEDI
jgi:hypothetical protein